MSTPCIIAVAITGSVPRKENNPAVPVTPDEQIESTHAAYEAGAALVHIHVREPDQSSSSDPELFAKVQDGIKQHCPGMIIQFSTGGRGRDQAQRGSMLHLRPDMASLATGSVNFPTIIYENPPHFFEDLARRMQENAVKPEIEVFDLAMLYSAAKLVDQGLLEEDAYIQFVLGVKNALPARRQFLDFLLSELTEVLPKANWCAAGIGRHQFEVNKWCLELGGHCRTGLEDNIRLSREQLAGSNAELVQRVVEAADDYHRRPATCQEARALLGLRAPS